MRQTTLRNPKPPSQAGAPRILTFGLAVVVVLVIIAAAVVPAAVMSATRADRITIETTSTTPAVCFNASDGGATISVQGGVQPYNYMWSNGDTTQNITGVTAGTYNVTVVDSNGVGVSATHALEITQPTLLIAAISSVTPTQCFGGTDGAMNATASDGSPGYTFAWSGGTPDGSGGVSALSAGNYTVTVTDTHGCDATASGQVTQPTLVVAAIPFVTPVECFGGTDGAMNATASGGSPGYTFAWSGGTPDGSDGINTLAAGNYTVTVTDTHGCDATASEQVTEPDLLVVAVAGMADVKCFGGSDGTVTVSTTGGTPIYTYLWSTGATSAGITGLSGGTYTVTATDDHACTASVSQEVLTPPSLLVLPAPVAADAICFDGTGTLTATASGGTGSYAYAWSNGGSDAVLVAVTGAYDVTVTDLSGCTMSSDGTIAAANPELVVDVTAVQALCGSAISGPDTASGYAEPSGGVPPYTYLWDDRDTGTGTFTTQNHTGMPGDTLFRLTVTDDVGCENVQLIDYEAPPALSNPSMAADPLIPCLGGGVGGVEVTSVIGGTPPLSYLWSTGATADSISGVVAGTYIVTITDANGCTVGGPSGGSFTLTDPAGPPC